jgi:threonine synthase
MSAAQPVTALGSPTATTLIYRCFRCGSQWPLETARVTCDCGGVLDLPLQPPTPPSGTSALPQGRTWVSAEAMRRASLGARPTPLVRWRDDADVWLKCDHLLPTGSFKDRGAHVLAGLAVDTGVEHVVVDSSGNAAAALAAHAARAGLQCTVFVPEGASPGKLRQIEAYGARLRLVAGPRETAAAHARSFAEEHGGLYAGHGVNPHFHDGTKSWIYEVIAELPQPDVLVLPVGSGSLLLGVLRGLDELVAAGWITRLPRIAVAQTTGYASIDPLAPALSSPALPAGEVPLAEGIAIREPSRREQMINRLAGLDATVCVVDDAAIRAARRELALGGFYVEPTSAVAWAAWRRQGAGGSTVVALTGHGLKTPA